VRAEWPDCTIIAKPAPAWKITSVVARLIDGAA
jgi:hypothetical protein